MPKVLDKVFKDNKFIAPNESLLITDKLANKFINDHITGSDIDISGVGSIIVKNIMQRFGETEIKLDSFKFTIWVTSYIRIFTIK